MALLYTTSVGATIGLLLPPDMPFWKVVVISGLAAVSFIVGYADGWFAHKRKDDA